MTNDIRELSQRKLNFFQTLKAVLWGFLGVRKGKGYTEDIAKLNPVHLIIAAVIGTVLFVVGLVMVAQWFVAQAV
ncbi:MULTISPECIES: DUF2970 domain-containing protein [unclassified Pusillimonas]|uniref:DUF2970 domain-containing protein n=1 Tax=unclassified Pusillimonas TaxID=2640016 RepID=UPI000B8E92E4|nr:MULTISPECIES: DUF2970 domain-containing protein [unclassified Pusillimonas]OXR50148.1 hypothetical protein PuT2_05135 [Pusillimonas sp. T2]ROT46467.1 DUF2970 domain-containing protein [Pusillimonas sp. NJUB218]